MALEFQEVEGTVSCWMLEVSNRHPTLLGCVSKLLAWCVKEPLLKFKLPAGKALKVCGFTVSSLVSLNLSFCEFPGVGVRW